MIHPCTGVCGLTVRASCWYSAGFFLVVLHLEIFASPHTQLIGFWTCRSKFSSSPCDVLPEHFWFQSFLPRAQIPTQMSVSRSPGSLCSSSWAFCVVVWLSCWLLLSLHLGRGVDCSCACAWSGCWLPQLACRCPGTYCQMLEHNVIQGYTLHKASQIVLCLIWDLTEDIIIYESLWKLNQ